MKTKERKKKNTILLAILGILLVLFIINWFTRGCFYKPFSDFKSMLYILLIFVLSLFCILFSRWKINKDSFYSYTENE
ncbi:MAG: membrane protease YdiL (CAAX protease family) [Flavobacteriaceae bacterium]|jgi:membrane protease YdiL (CAAX protease family)